MGACVRFTLTKKNSFPLTFFTRSEFPSLGWDEKYFCNFFKDYTKSIQVIRAELQTEHLWEDDYA